MARAASLAALLLSCGCYTLGAPRPLAERVAIAVRDDDGIDVDLAALVASSLRRAVADRTELVLAEPSGAQAVLEVEVLSGRSGLSPLADTSLRTAEYRVEVVLEARLVRDAEVLWSSGAQATEATYLGTPGPITALDGQRRIALTRAADEAARRMVSAMLYAR